MGDFEVSRLRAAEIESAAIRVEVVEADVVEVTGFDARGSAWKFPCFWGLMEKVSAFERDHLTQPASLLFPTEHEAPQPDHSQKFQARGA